MVDASYQSPNLAFPADGTRVLPHLLDFSNAGVLTIDVTKEFLDGNFNFAQSIYIDNADNAAPLDLIFLGGPVPQRIRAQAYSQGMYPITWPKGAGRFTAQTTQGQRINVQLFNCAMPYVVWGPSDGVFSTPNLSMSNVDMALAIGDNVLVPLALGQSVKLYRAILEVDNPAKLIFKTGIGGAAIFTAQLYAGGSLSFQPSGIPWVTSAVGTPLVVNSSAVVNMVGGLGYVQS